jgi:hypothetical protein
MEAKELRIGNWIKSETEVFGEKKFREWQVTIDDLSYIFSHPENYFGIQLTEEWLLKFGWIFNFDLGCYEKFPNGDARMFLSHKEVNNSFDMFNYVLKSTICKNIYYVHQLQNLFYCLCGKELEVKTS